MHVRKRERVSILYMRLSVCLGKRIRLNVFQLGQIKTAGDNELTLRKHIKQQVSVFLFLCCVVAMSACSDKDNGAKTASDSSQQQNKPPLTFSIHPYDNPSRLVERFQPLTDYLSRQLKREVKFIINRSYIDQIKQITQGTVDIYYMGPTPYLRAQDHYLKPESRRLNIIVAEAQENVLAYQSVLVTRDSSDIQTIEQVRGHTVTFGAPHSFSSHYVPRYMLQSAGINFAQLKDYAFLNRHEKVALAVLHGDFDVGGLRKKVAERYIKKATEKKGTGLRIIAKSSLLPPHVIVARSDLDKSLINKYGLPY